MNNNTPELEKLDVQTTTIYFYSFLYSSMTAHIMNIVT